MLTVGRVALLSFVVVAGVTGSAAVTEEADTSTASGTLTITGTSTTTEAADTSTASGTLTITGTSTTTEAADTSTASGSSAESVTGTCAVTEEADTSTASGSGGVVGLIAAKLNPVSTFAPATTVRTFNA
jgi:hypothetical protein